MTMPIITSFELTTIIFFQGRAIFHSKKSFLYHFIFRFLFFSFLNKICLIPLFSYCVHSHGPLVCLRIHSYKEREDAVEYKVKITNKTPQSRPGLADWPMEVVAMVLISPNTIDHFYIYVSSKSG